MMRLTYDSLSLLAKCNNAVAQADKRMMQEIMYYGAHQYGKICGLLTTYTFEYIIVRQNITFTNEDVMKIYRSRNRTTKIILEYMNGICDMSLLNIFMIVYYPSGSEILRFDFPCTYVMFVNHTHSMIPDVDRGPITSVVINGKTWTVSNAVFMIDTVTGFLYADCPLTDESKHNEWINIMNKVKKSCIVLNIVEGVSNGLILRLGKYGEYIAPTDEQRTCIRECMMPSKNITMPRLMSFTILEKEAHKILGVDDVSKIVLKNMYYPPDISCTVNFHTSNYMAAIQKYIEILDSLDMESLESYVSFVTLKIATMVNCTDAIDIINRFIRMTYINIRISTSVPLEEVIESIVPMLLNHRTRLDITITYINEPILIITKNNMSLHVKRRTITPNVISQLLRLYYNDGVNTLYMNIGSYHECFDYHELVRNYERLTMHIQFKWKHISPEHLDIHGHNRAVFNVGGKKFICYDHIMFSKSLRKCNIGMSIFTKLDLRESYITHLVLFGNVHKINEHAVSLFPKGLRLVELVLLPIEITDHMTDELILAIQYIPDHISILLRIEGLEISMDKFKAFTRYIEFIY